MQCNQSPPPRREAQAIERRRHLLDTARTLFIQNGFHRTGVAQISAASGIKVGQIYRDFASKEHIIVAICQADNAAWLEEASLAAAIASSDRFAIRHWIRRFSTSDESADECRMMTEIIAEAGRNQMIADMERDMGVRVRTSLKSALEALQPTRDVTLLIELILTMGLGLLSRQAMSEDDHDADLSAYVTRLIDAEIDAALG